MKNLRNTVRSDIALLAMLALTFVAMIFFALDSQNVLQNGIILGVAALVVVVAYHTSFQIALILNAIAVLLLLSYTVFSCLRVGAAPSAGMYMWIAWIPLMTMATSAFSSNAKALQRENDILRTQLDALATIDDAMGLKNLRAYNSDMAVYLNLSKRYEFDLVLIVWELSNQIDLRRTADPEAVVQVARQISSVIEDTLRTEDAVYLTGEEPYEWAALLLMHNIGTDHILNRVRDAVSQINLLDNLRDSPFVPELSAGVEQYDKKENISAFAFLSRAKEKMTQGSAEEVSL